jgi:electron-transferring-flavoprotein dehydrogenase
MCSRLVSLSRAALHKSWVAEELKIVRNTHSAFHLPGGTLTGMIHSGLSCLITGGKEPWSLHNKTPDADRTRPAKEFSEIEYPKPDGVLSFDLLTNLQRSGALLLLLNVSPRSLR